ncbi:MAG TPA: flagellar basal-body MS-ring/collar protein FliF [Candidatus Acidoferrales bacterium]|nr:flagellar basal-body MS-ring/collar protein FliF [Candidatus Acidoferrales bacterium]
MERLSSLWSELAGRLTAIWQNQNRQTRMIAVIGGAVVAIGLLALGWLYFGRGQTYQTLFANLSAEDAATVTQHLKDDKVPYRLSADGKTVYVPESDVSDERVAIAGSGMLKGGTQGYELFDKTNFGMTEFQEKIDKTRAIEGELERTIDGLNPVESSRVNIATPDQSLYTTTQEPTTASIAIKTKAGQNLDADQVRGITMLVANAVDGLKPENVTIVNQDGQILLPGAAGAVGGSGSGDVSADALKLTSEQLLAKERYESALQQSIQSMLDNTLGKNHAVARVSTKMDFDANSSESKIYAPQGTVLSSQTERESYVGTQPVRNPAIGVPGTTSNIGTYQAAQQTANGRYNRSKSTTNYDISEQNVKHIDAPGKVLQTSVAVLVDSNAQPASGLALGANAQPYQLTPANVQQIRNAVIAAGDLNIAQGDQVSVEAIPFNPSVENLGAPAAAATTILGVPLWALIAVGGVALLAAIGLLVARTRRGRFAPAAELPSFDTSLAEELPPFEEHPILEGAPGIAAPIRSAADLTREQMIEYVTTVAQENPDSIAKLVKLWLAE